MTWIKSLVLSIFCAGTIWADEDELVSTTYRGKIDTTVSGKTCQAWTSQLPNKHAYTPEKYPDAGLGEHNYCRDPGGHEGFVWCYTTESGTRWEKCDVGISEDEIISEGTLDEDERDRSSIAKQELIGTWGMDLEWGYNQQNSLQEAWGKDMEKIGQYIEFRSDGILVVNTLRFSKWDSTLINVVDGWASTWDSKGGITATETGRSTPDTLFIGERIFFTNYENGAFQIIKHDEYYERVKLEIPQDFKPTVYAMYLGSFFDNWFLDVWLGYSRWTNSEVQNALSDAVVFPAVVKELFGLGEGESSAVKMQSWGEVKGLHHIFP